MRRWLVIASFLGSVAFMLLAASQPIPQAQNGPQQHNEIREQSPSPIVSSVTEPSTEPQQQNSNKGADSVWQKAFAPESWPNWFLSLAGIFGVWAALRTLKAIENQAKLQKIAMRQWIVTRDWTQQPRYLDTALVGIVISIPILNETAYPLVLDSVVVTLNGSEQIKNSASQIAPGGREPYIMSFYLRMESLDVSQYRQNGFILMVECLVHFYDVFEKKQAMTFNRLYRCGPQEFEQKDQYTQDKKPD